MTVSRISDQVSLVVDEVSTAAATPGIRIAATIMDADNYPLDPNPTALFCAKKTGGGSGYVRIYDVTNTQELGLIEVTASSYTIIKQALADYILSGQAKVEFWIYTDGTGTIYVDCASLGMCWVS